MENALRLLFNRNIKSLFFQGGAKFPKKGAIPVSTQRGGGAIARLYLPLDLPLEDAYFNGSALDEDIPSL